MAPEENQKAADSQEQSAAERFRRGKVVSVLVAEAIRRDEAMQRLELTLKLLPRHR